MKKALKSKVLVDESGFTLTEVLVTMMMMLIVLFALYSLFDMTLRIYSIGNDKTEAVENARLGLGKMKREIQAAYPYDVTDDSTNSANTAAIANDYLFWDPANSAAAAMPSATSITFGNDLNGNYKIRDDTASEQITYYARSTANPANPCDTAAAAPCTLYRTVGSGNAQSVVEYLRFDDRGTASTSDDIPGVKFEYLDASGNATTDQAAIRTVRISIAVAVDRGIEEQPVTQVLTTDLALRNRGEK
jgi:prepilin-type N-terminal cleavage/methylation domain-containing protein